MGIDRDSYPPEFSWVPQVLKSNKLVYIGLRDVDDGEKEIYVNTTLQPFQCITLTNME